MAYASTYPMGVTYDSSKILLLTHGCHSHNLLIPTSSHVRANLNSLDSLRSLSILTNLIIRRNLTTVDALEKARLPSFLMTDIYPM